MSSNCVKKLDFDRGKGKQEKESLGDSEEDDLLSQAYEDFLLKDSSNETAPGDPVSSSAAKHDITHSSSNQDSSALPTFQRNAPLNKTDQTNDADSTFKENIDDFDLITPEDLLGPSSKTCKENLPVINKTLVQTNDVDSTCKEKINGLDMTQEDLLVPSSKTCDESSPTFPDLINNYVHQSFLVLKTLRELSLEAFNKDDFNKEDNDLSESSVIATLILMDIFDKACKKAKQLKRWRIPNSASWKVNVAKKRRAEGSVYVIKNKIRPAKVPKEVDCSKCYFRCTEFINEEIRNNICRKYWNLDYASQKKFLLANMEIKKPKTMTLERKRQRTSTTQCFFKIEDKKIKVCQKFFCNTLCIAQSVVQHAVKNRDVTGQYNQNYDPRGRCEPANKTPPEKVDEVRNHIRSFPCMESHYIRKDSKRQYLDCKLSIGKMYSLYVEECNKKDSTPVSEITYRRIFGTDFNLGFFKPKKDQCLICTRYAREDKKNKQELEQEYAEHIKRKEACNNEKTKDKEKAEKEEQFVSLTFDLQSILQIPSGDIGLLYYTRKLTVYNLTVYESALPNNAFCFTWSEINGKKGSSEIGTILYFYLSTCVPKHVNEVSLFSDTCGGQNRNKYVAAVLLWAVHNIENLQIIEQKFLESGHSYMEADSMHSAIEKAQENTSIYSMSDWINIFKRARAKKIYKKNNKKIEKQPYQVKEFKFNEFKDLKDLAEKILINTKKDQDSKTVKWMKIKRIRYVKGEAKIYFNYDMSDTFHIIDVTTKSGKNDGPGSSTNTEPEKQREHGYGTRNRKRKEEINTCIEISEIDESYFPKDLQPLYKTPLDISVAKKKDLLELCRKGVIPEEFHRWFENLKTNISNKDRIPDATISDDEPTSSDEI